MYYKLKYSSLLIFKKKNNFVLYLKGPLGINYLKIPYNINITINSSTQVIIFSSKSGKSNKKKSLLGFLTIFKNSCRNLVFGDLIGLNIQGLGLKFLKINDSVSNKKYLSMSLGYSDLSNLMIDSKRSIFFLKDIRHIYIYSTDYSYLKNLVFMIINLKKPNKFRKRKNGITLSSSII